MEEVDSLDEERKMRPEKMECERYEESSSDTAHHIDQSGAVLSSKDDQNSRLSSGAASLPGQ